MTENKNFNLTLNDLIIELRDILQFSLQDLYLTSYAIQNESISRAEEKKQEIFFVTGGRKQIKDINIFFIQKFSGEGLFIEEKYGKIIPTELGRIFVREVDLLIQQACDSFNNIRLHHGRTIKISATQFMMDLVARIYPNWQIINNNTNIDLRLIRTSELEESLLNRKADLAFGAVIMDDKNQFILSDKLEFYPIKKETVGILTNINTNNIFDEKEFKDFIENTKLIVPKSGIMKTFIDTMYERYPILKPNTISWCHDIFFGISLLQNNVISKGMMFILKGAAKWTSSIWDQNNENQKLFYIDLSDDLLNSNIYVGLFRRKIDKNLPARHPLKKCWETFKEKFENI
ncbi:MAG: hypothetical protein WAR79_14025 [Melioribacteraceae bacterium]